MLLEQWSLNVLEGDKIRKRVEGATDPNRLLSCKKEVFRLVFAVKIFDTERYGNILVAVGQKTQQRQTQQRRRTERRLQRTPTKAKTQC